MTSHTSACVFRVNEVAAGRGTFYAPVLTFDLDGVPVLWSWTVRRDMTVFRAPAARCQRTRTVAVAHSPGRAIPCDWPT